jgi:hypothetical protein
MQKLEGTITLEGKINEAAWKKIGRNLAIPLFILSET